MSIPTHTLTLKVYQPDNVTLVEGSWRFWYETHDGIAINDLGHGIAGSYIEATASGVMVQAFPDTTNAGFDPQGAFMRGAFTSTDRRIRIKTEPFLMDADKTFANLTVVSTGTITPSLVALAEDARDAAASSATSAAASATTAGSAATSASGSATSAGTSASTATTKAGEASTSASNAATSASTASTAATTATTKADEASTSATNAATSATSAAGSATAAGTNAALATSMRYAPGTGMRPLPLADVVTLTAGTNPRPIEYARGYLWGRVGTAVSRSSDMGVTWSAAFTSPVTFSGFVGTSDGQMLAMCSDQGTNGGWYKSSGWSDSSPSAATWSKVLAHSGGDADFYRFGLDGDGTKFIAAEYAETAIVFGAGRADSKKVWISQDAGSTWSVVYDTSVSEPTDNPNTHLHGVCYDRYSGRFFFVQGHSVTHGIYYSDDQGATWTKLTTLGFDPEPSPTVMRATARGIVCGTDSEPAGVYVIPRNADPSPSLLRMQVAYRWPTGALGLIGYAFGFAHDLTTDTVFLGYRSTIAGKASVLTASDGRVASKIWDGPAPSGTGTAAISAVAAANGKLAWFQTSPDGDFHYRASQPAFGAPGIDDTGNILGGTVVADAGSTGPGSIAVGAGAYASSVHAISISPNDGQSTANYAISVGRQVRATGLDSIAIARSAAASGPDTIAIGRSAAASSVSGRSIAIGQFAAAAGADAVALGSTATSAAGASAVAVGQSSSAGGLRAIAIGLLPNASAQDAIAVGRLASATFTGAIAVGENTTTGAANAIAIGSASTSAGGSASIAIGTTASSAGLRAVAVGYGTIAGDATNSYSIAIGYGASAALADAVVVGRQAIAGALRGIAIGQIATASGADSIAIGSTTPTAAGTSAIAVGQGASSGGLRSIAVGVTPNASGQDALAVGRNASATFGSAIAIGESSTTGAANAIAIGTAVASAGGLSSIAIGTTASAAGSKAVAVGANTVSSGTNGVALGNTASAAGSNAIAIGPATATNSGIAIGGGATASALGTVAIGRDNAGTGASATVANDFVLGTALHQVKVPGKLSTAASTTTQAGLVVPHGTAPTTPTDGAIWTTSAGGLFVRINGVTKTVTLT